MEPPPKPAQGQTSLFQVYLRLRPPMNPNTAAQASKQEYLTVERPESQSTEEDDDGKESFAWPTHITVQPPNESRKRAVEKFAFTKVFEEDASQLELFEEAEMVSLIKGVLCERRDGLVATLGVTGSGKTHTILGSKSQRGMTQMSLDVLFRSLESTIQNPNDLSNPFLMSSIAASDASEAQLFSAKSFIETIYSDPYNERGRNSRAQTPMSVVSRSQTPMTVRNPLTFLFSPSFPHISTSPSIGPYPEDSSPGNKSPIARMEISTTPTVRLCLPEGSRSSYGDAWTWTTPPKKPLLPSQLPFWNCHRISKRVAKISSRNKKDSMMNFPRRHLPHRPSALPQLPDVSEFVIPNPNEEETVVLVSMYEVYNDRIFDLLTPSAGGTKGGNQKDRRRHLLFKSTEGSQDRKVVAGLRKVVCGTYEDALMVLETGLLERRVAGTGSNSVSSRSHGFFCVEVKKKVQDRRYGEESWVGNTLTVVDLAGSERARNAKTAGATLAEAGKINESLMYLGQCLQTQSDFQDGNKQASIVPYRQCKLTELLFSNSFPSPNHVSSYPRQPQRAIMIVTADPQGDFNATSQILRYSALAREVTVPRIPSVTSQILAGPAAASGRKSPSERPKSSLYTASAQELETAALEIAKISDDYDALALKLAEEEIARTEAEVKWRAAEERCLLVEQEIREECWEEMEQRLEEERRRWQAAWDEQASRHDEHLDKKLDLLSKGVKIHEDPETTPSDHLAELEQENDVLRMRIANLERELHSRSPTRKTAAKSKKNTVQPRQDSLDYSYASGESDVENSPMRLGEMNIGSPNRNRSSPSRADGGSSPSVSKKLAARKQRKLTSRQRDLGPECVLDEFE
ncbi:hypothetical protein FQN55_007899 [Onygenales sp. PD_40]|nr:hypothetical protein FQN55_007899 [Onygenales sp. PD_40]